MDGWFSLFDMCLLTVCAAISDACSPEERRFFGEKREVFGCQVAVQTFLTASVRAAETSKVWGNPTTSEASQHVDDMLWEILIGWTRSGVNY